MPVTQIKRRRSSAYAKQCICKPVASVTCLSMSAKTVLPVSEQERIQPPLPCSFCPCMQHKTVSLKDGMGAAGLGGGDNPALSHSQQVLQLLFTQIRVGNSIDHSQTY